MRRAVKNFERLKAAAPLACRGDAATLRLSAAHGRSFPDRLAGCFSLDDYDRDVIKKHEHTRRDKEDDRTRHLLDLRAQTGPVFLTYRARPAIDGLVERITTGAAVRLHRR